MIEIVVSIGILVLIGATMLVSFVSSRATHDLITSTQNVISVLRLAQSKTIAGENDIPWGVHIDPSQITLFNGTTFSGALSTQVFLLPSSVQTANLNFNGGGPDVIFRRLDGGTNQYGSFDIKVKSFGTGTITVKIDGSGKVYQSGTLPVTTGTRLVDARHRAFNLGWSIQNSTQLTLTFSDPPNPDTVVPITMASYFDQPKSVFDWSGTEAVGGQNQTLRIHTVYLSAANTILHVDRDCRKNTKQLKITIDSRDLATYNADCKTITVWPFGGTISEP